MPPMAASMPSSPLIPPLPSSSTPLKFRSFPLSTASSSFPSSSSRIKCLARPYVSSDLNFVLLDALHSSGIDTTHAKEAREGFLSQIRYLSDIERETSISINKHVDLGKTALFIAAEDDSLISHSSVPLPVDAFVERLDDLSMGYCSHYTSSFSLSPETFLQSVEKYMFSCKEIVNNLLELCRTLYTAEVVVNLYLYGKTESLTNVRKSVNFLSCSSSSPSNSSSSSRSLPQGPGLTNVHPMVSRAKFGIHKLKMFVHQLSPSASESSTFLQASKNSDWVRAMQFEMHALHRNNSWDLVDPPTGPTIVGCKWVDKLKYNLDCSIVWYKARLVAKRFSQMEGVNYFEIFISVVKPAIVCLVLSYAFSGLGKRFGFLRNFLDISVHLVGAALWLSQQHYIQDRQYCTPMLPNISFDVIESFRRTHGRIHSEPRCLYLHSVLTHRIGSIAMLSLIYSEILKMLRLWSLLDFDVEIFYPHDVHSLPRGYHKQKSKESDQPHIMTTQRLLVEILGNLKDAFWPFRRDGTGSLFLSAAQAAYCGDRSNIVEDRGLELASAKAAQHRLERGVWTSVPFGDMRRALSACERLIILNSDPKELRDYSILLYHCGFYKQSMEYLKLYQDIKAKPQTCCESPDSLSRAEEEAAEKLRVRLDLMATTTEEGWIRAPNFMTFLSKTSEPW